MTDNNTDPRPELGPETKSEFDRQKTAWEQPAFQRIGADDAETGISNGPEILILLS